MLAGGKPALHIAGQIDDNNPTMIGRLTGFVVDQDGDGNVVIDVNGVGYDVMAPMGTVGRARAIAGEDKPVTLHVHTHVREDVLSLFGFATSGDRLAFRTLIGISSVGPRTAIGILSHLSAVELAKAIQGKDVTSLVAVPGVGKRTAERLLLELRDKLDFAAQELAVGATVQKPAAVAGKVSSQVVEALSRLGFRQADAERAVASLGRDVEREPIDRVLRDALAALGQ